MLTLKKKQKYLLFVSSFLYFLFFLGAVIVSAKQTSVCLKNTDVFELISQNNGISYEIWVSLPKGYDALGHKKYSTLYVLDASYTFSLVRNIVQHMSDRGLIEDHILVGIGYTNDDADTLSYRDKSTLSTYKLNRTRDYTPTFMREDEGYGAQYNAYPGGADKFKSFVQKELIPTIQTHYHTNEHRGLVGHSYGGLFTVWVYLTDPSLFSSYLAVSPSLWYAQSWIVHLAKNERRPRQGKLYLATGQNETKRMKTAAKDFMWVISRSSSPHRLRYDILPNHIHNTSFPEGFLQGLRFFYGGSFHEK